MDERQQPLGGHDRGDRAEGHGHGPADGDRVQRDQRTEPEVAVLPNYLAEDERAERPGQGPDRRLPPTAQRDGLDGQGGQDGGEPGDPGTSSPASSAPVPSQASCPAASRAGSTQLRIVSM
ncbi:hypothetical protein BM536_016955 [Streptomyces phaeoluteigriseus]|uniref:Uncharacterized protein n=1 Tax=Streptomyces phaeoluteigriseus TaxID=114686 RepID=A0A1V6MUL5_9ACTN|nr:hypothetical protein BM536_016955 [Streptomyces phaeoluteigriseus]